MDHRGRQHPPADGIEPAKDRMRQSARRSSFESQREVTASVDFTTIELLTRRGLVTCRLPSLLELAGRRSRRPSVLLRPTRSPDRAEPSARR